MFKYLCLSLSLLSALDTNAMCCGFGKSKRQRLWSERLISAAAVGNDAEVARSLRAGADVNWTNVDGCMALMFSADRGYTRVVDQLLKANANIDLANVYGNTALILASYKGHTRVVDQLLKANANLDLADVYGNTALMCAAATRVDNGYYKAIIKVLLNNGAKTHLVNKDKKTALELAEKKYASGVVRLIGPRARWENGDGNRVAWVTACVMAARQESPAGAGVGIASRVEVVE